MPNRRETGRIGLPGLVLFLALTGCQSPMLPRDYEEGTRASSPNFVDGPAPLRTPSPERAAGDASFEDSLTGGQVFQMYCAQCHNRRPMSERAFANYRNVAAHMRTRVNLTGKEYEKLVAWMRQVQDAPLPTPDTEPSPKRFTFAQPIPSPRPAQEPTAGEPTTPAP